MAKWIPIGEAAQYLGVSRDTLRRWGKAGRIKAQRSPTNRRYYTKEQLDQVIKEKGNKKTPPPATKSTSKNNPLKLVGLGLAGFVLAVLLTLGVLFFLR